MIPSMILTRPRSVSTSCPRRCTSKTRSLFSTCGTRRAKSDSKVSYHLTSKTALSPLSATMSHLVSLSRAWTSGSRMHARFVTMTCFWSWLETSQTWLTEGRWALRKGKSTRNAWTSSFLRLRRRRARTLRASLTSLQRSWQVLRQTRSAATMTRTRLVGSSSVKITLRLMLKNPMLKKARRRERGAAERASSCCEIYIE